MKLTTIFSVVVCSILSACYEDTSDLVSKIQTPTDKGFYPVSSNTFIDLINKEAIATNRIYAPNTNISFELQYWSESAIQEINLYSTIGNGFKTKIVNSLYADVAAFSKIKSADTLIYTYKMPVVAAETTIRLDVEIVNKNGLTLNRLITVKDKP